MNSRLLVAESDPSLCDIYRLFFSRQGFEVATAAHGLECLETLRDFMPDVLALEWEMPWGGGVLARLRDEYPLLSVDVVVVTSSGTLPDLSASHAELVVGCLVKPFHMAELLQMVRGATAANRHLV